MEPKPLNEYAQPITSMTKEEYFDYLELAVGPLLEYQKEWAWAYANSMSKEVTDGGEGEAKASNSESENRPH